MGRYKLFGMFWDSREINLSRCPEIKAEAEIGYCEDYQVEENLFDFEDIRRKINFSELLRCEQKNDFFDIAAKLQWCDTVYIIVDYIPKNITPIMDKFFFKTLLQACCFFQSVKKSLLLVMVMDKQTRRRAAPYWELYLPNMKPMAV